MALATIVLALAAGERGGGTAPAGAAESASVAAEVAGGVVTVAEVDARCGEKCARLVGEIAAREREALERLVAEALLDRVPRPLPTPEAVSEADVAGYLATHAADFAGPPERDRAAVRFYLERERRRDLERSLVAAQRERVPLEERGVGLAEGGGDPGALLARVDGEPIRRADVEARAALPLYRLRGELARERRRQAELLLEERLWAAEARRLGTSAEALRAKLARDVPAIEDAEVQRYVEREQGAQGAGAVARAERVRPYLEFRARRAAAEAFLDAARARHGAKLRIAVPDPPRLRLGPGDGGFRPPSGRVRVILLTSYRGEVSRSMWAVARRVASDPQVALAVRPLLPQWDPEATTVAAAVRCAGAQGRFWEMQDAAASADPLPDRAALRAMAAGLGLEPEGFERCLADPQTRASVLAESAEAERLGLVEPPALLVDGQVFGGLQSAERIHAAVAAARGE